jgi:DNA-binding NarL/FixJ family response regulator
MATKAKIFIVDDHPVMRMGLTQLINSAGDLDVCGEAGSANETIENLALLGQADLVIIDVSLFDRNGLELLKDIRVEYPELKCLIISSHDEDVYAERALRLGGRGYVMKNRAPDQLVDAIRQVLGGGIFLSPDMTRQMMEAFAGGKTAGSGLSSLTDRELQVYRAIGEGKGTREIAELLGISVRTVDAHRTHIKDKLGLSDATELSYQAIRWMESQN